MTWRFPEKILFHLLFSLMIAAPAGAGALESDPESSELPENAIVVEVETFPSGAWEKFLQTYRLIWQQSKLDVSDVLKKHRKDFSNIKRENSRILKSIRKNKLPKVILKRVRPARNQTPSSAPVTTPAIDIEPDFIFKGVLTRHNFAKQPRPKPKDKLLSLEERQRLAEIKRRRRKETRRFKRSDIGRLKAEIEQGPLKGHQLKLAQLSDRIKKLRNSIWRDRIGGRTVFLNLGNAYLESQRYLNSLDYEKQIKLTRYAPHSGIALGSYELALWTYKLALTQDPNDGDTNFLMGEIFSEMGNKNEALERARNAEHLFTQNRERKKVAQTRSFIESLGSTPPGKYSAKF